MDTSNAIRRLYEGQELTDGERHQLGIGADDRKRYIQTSDDILYCLGCFRDMRGSHHPDCQGGYRCGAYKETWQELDKPEDWLGCPQEPWHEGNHGEPNIL